MTLIEFRVRHIKRLRFLMFYIPYYSWDNIILYYNIEENSIYYKDKNKDIKTKKDLARSIEMLWDIMLRLQYHGVSFTKIQDNVNKFIGINLLSQATIPQSKFLLLGTASYNIEKLITNMETLDISDLDEIESCLTALKNSNSAHIDKFITNL